MRSRSFSGLSVRHAALSVALLALAGCGASGATLGEALPAIGGAPAAAEVVPPEVGQCRAPDSSEIFDLSNDSPLADCTAKHTTITYYVGDFESRPPEREEAEKTCAAKLPEATGLEGMDNEITTIEPVWFRPTARQYALGARWLRCDLAAIGLEEQAAELPSGGLPLFADGKIPDAFALCRSKGGENVTCDAPHTHRAGARFEGSGEKVPTEKTVQRWADKKCNPVMKTDDYLITWPSKGAWDFGRRDVTCWFKTRS